MSQCLCVDVCIDNFCLLLMSAVYVDKGCIWSRCERLTHTWFLDVPTHFSPFHPSIEFGAKALMQVSCAIHVMESVFLRLTYTNPATSRSTETQLSGKSITNLYSLLQKLCLICPINGKKH